MLKIVFMGSDPIALPALNWLAAAGRDLARVAAVFTQPDRAAGRGQKIRTSDIKQWALARGLPVVQPEKFGPAEQKLLADLRADLVLVMAYGHILAQEVIATPRLGIMNLHTSVLPRYRGASPIQTAICSGESVTGVSLMRLVRKLDAGPVAAVEEVEIAPLDTVAEVEAKLGAACVPLLAKCLPALAAGTLEFREQDEAQVTFCRRLEKSDGVLDFARPAAELAARINGLAPWPGCAIEINGQPVRLGLADAVQEEAEAGQVQGADADGLLIGTARGLLRLRRLQRPGGKMLPAPEFLRGWPVPRGTAVPSRAMPLLVSREPFPRARPA